jgi:hypothetical protein
MMIITNFLTGFVTDKVTPWNPNYDTDDDVG